MTVRLRLLDAIERVGRVAEQVVSPGGISSLRGKPRSIAAQRLVRAVDDAGIRPAVVIDVGANKGQFAAAALRRWPSATVHAFEALPALAAELRQIDAGSRLVVHQVALGRTQTLIDFHEHRYSPSSSALQALDGSDVARVIQVPQRRLDDLFDSGAVSDPLLLKLDVQGYEVEVVEGAPEILSRAAAVLVEQALEPTYEGQPRFEEVHRRLISAGLALHGIADWRKVGGRIIEVDHLYLRRPATT